MQATVKALSKEEQKQFEELGRKQTAFDDQEKTMREERSGGIAALDKLLDRLATRMEDRVREGKAEKGDDVRTDHEKLVGTVEDQQREITALTKSIENHRGGGIGYDHEAATREDVERGDGQKKARFSLGGAAVAKACMLYGGAPGAAMKDLEMLAEWQAKQYGGSVEKALQLGVSSGAGFLVPPQWLNEMVALLRPNLVAGVLGATFRALDRPSMFRKQTGKSTAFWVGEGMKATKSQPSFGRIQLTPKPLVSIVPISNDLLESVPENLGSEIEQDIAMGQAEALDFAIIKGTGGLGEPIGMVNLAGGTTDWAAVDDAVTVKGAAQLITDKLDEMSTQISARDVPGRQAWAMHPLTVQQLRLCRDADGRPILFNANTNDPHSINGPGNSEAFETGILWGKPFATTTQLIGAADDSDLILAAWQYVTVANFGAARVLASEHATDPRDNESAFLQRETWIRVDQKWDTALLYDAAVQVAINLDLPFGLG